jgi:predicted nucleic acid-binding protein
VILLDTNVISGMMRPNIDPPLAAWLSSLGSESLAVSTVTIAEIAYGLSLLPDSRRRTQLMTSSDRLIDAFDVLDFDRSMAARSGAFRSVRAAIGRPISLADSMIGATAAEAGARLATRNTRDFAGLGLSLVDPWSA